MKIISADYILTCNDNFDILENSAICFDENIIDIGNFENLCKKYPDAKIYSTEPNTILMPGLINLHTHLEFSANRSLLSYGNFITWLDSVIENRDEIMEHSTNENMTSAINEMIKGGTTTFGAISSQGLDLEVCANTKARVIYFNEILGSNPASVDIMYNDFLQRYNGSLEMKNDRFIPAISVHSPYSTHPILAKKVLSLAREKSHLVSTHFMESPEEREWIDSSSGGFKAFFDKFFPNSKALTSGEEYIKLFDGVDTLFTHCVHVNEKELELLSNQNATITHCPVSNRLLGTGRFDFEKFNKHNFNITIGTDGFSSNRSLNQFEELKCALYTHFDADLTKLAKELIKASTCNASLSAKISAGKIEKDYLADILSIKLPQKVKQKEQVALQTILHTQKADKIFIQGEEIEII